MAMRPSLFTLAGLAVEFERNVRTIARALRDIPPDGKASGRDGWKISTAHRALTGGLDETGEAINPARQKARLDSARADKTEAELAKLRSELVPAGDVDRTWAAIVGWFRTVLLTIPSMLAPRILPSMKTAEIEAIIRDAINDAIEELQRTDVESSDEGPGASPDSPAGL